MPLFHYLALKWEQKPSLPHSGVNIDELMRVKWLQCCSNEHSINRNFSCWILHSILAYRYGQCYRERKASLVTQWVKNLSAMQETQVRFLGQEDPLEKEMTTHFSILAWRIPWTEDAGQATVHVVTRVRHDLATKPPPGGKKDQAQVPSSALPAQYLGTYSPCLSFCLIIFQIKKSFP